MGTKIIIVMVLVAAFVGAYLLFFPGSSGQPQILAQDKFISAYVELATLAEQMPIGTPEYEREKERVLRAMGVDPEQVEKALAMYNEKPELWQPVWERIQTELEKREPDYQTTPAASSPPDSN